VVGGQTFPRAFKEALLTEKAPKSVVFVNRIPSGAFGKVNNTQEGDYPSLKRMILSFYASSGTSPGRHGPFGAVDKKHDFS